MQGPSRYSLTFLCLVPGFFAVLSRCWKEAIMVEQTAQVVALWTLLPSLGLLSAPFRKLSR